MDSDGQAITPPGHVQASSVYPLPAAQTSKVAPEEFVKQEKAFVPSMSSPS